MARSDADQKGSLYRSSLRSRLFTLPITLPSAAALAYLISIENPVTSAFAAIASVLIGVGGSWFFIGDSRPRSLFLCDALPRAMSVVAGAGLLSLHVDILWYALMLVTGSICSVTISAFVILRSYPSPRKTGTKSNRRGLAEIYRQQVTGLAISLMSTVYLSAPLLIVSISLPSYLASYALADRLKQQSMTFVGPVAQTLQGAVPRGARALLERRVRKAFYTAIMLGALGGTCFSTLGPFASQILGAGQLVLGFELTVPFGVAFGLNIVSLIVGSACLMVVDRQRDVAASALIGMIVSVPLLLLGIHSFGLVGAAWAVALSQAAVCAYQVSSLNIHWRNVAER